MASGGKAPAFSEVLVSSVAGDGTAESKDGIGTAARLNPHAIIASADGKSLIFSEHQFHRIRRYDLAEGRVSTLLGTSQGFKNGDSKSTQLSSPYALCTDPLKPNNLFIGDRPSIRYWDTATDQVSLIAGDTTEGYADGVGPNARFKDVAGLVCHPNGKTLYLSDHQNDRIRMVDLTTRSVTTIAGDGKAATRDGTGVNCSLYRPREIVFDRSPNVKPNSVLLIASYEFVRRFDITTGVVATLKFENSTLNSLALVYTAGGHLIASCWATESMYSIDPLTSGLVRLAGSGIRGFADGEAAKAAFSGITGLVVIDREQCVFACDYWNQRIRRITLPPQFFAGPAKADTESRELKLAAELKAMTARCTAQSVELKAAGDRYTALDVHLKAADSLAAASKVRIAELEKRLAERDSKQFLAEIRGRPPKEWRAETVVYWVEYVFGAEHKSAQITEFVKELKARTDKPNAGSGGSGGGGGAVTVSVLLSLAQAQMKTYRELKLSDPQTIELLQGSIESLKADGSSSGTTSEALPLPP